MTQVAFVGLSEDHFDLGAAGGDPKLCHAAWRRNETAQLADPLAFAHIVYVDAGWIVHPCNGFRCG
jgi:hypothetical protein